MRPPLTRLTLAVIGIVVTASLAVNGVVLSRSGSDSTSSIPAQIESESGADARFLCLSGCFAG